MISSALKNNFPTNYPPIHARQKRPIQRYLVSPAGKHLQNELAQAQQGVIDAWSLRVEKLPAVVVDRRYVVYGEPDAAKAVALIERARSLVTMRRSRFAIRPLSLAITFSLSFSASAAINSAAIIASTLSPTCLEYKVVGICYWLLCTPFGCKVKTSTKVRHYVPDAVVSAYANTG